MLGRQQERKRRSRDEGERDALSIVEQAFHLLRTTPAHHFLIYYAGVIPFIAALLYFWADMSRSSYANRDAALIALGMVGFFGLKLFSQAVFAKKLWETLSPNSCPQHSRWQRFRYFAALTW
ncbi:MAG: hypothetical protein AAF226_10155, partial [Verrucomicrobiota bacterium]